LAILRKILFDWLYDRIDTMTKDFTDKNRFFDMLERAVNPHAQASNRKGAKNRGRDSCTGTETPQDKKKGTSEKQRGTSRQ
jgi:hypothetical protein